MKGPLFGSIGLFEEKFVYASYAFAAGLPPGAPAMGLAWTLVPALHMLCRQRLGTPCLSQEAHGGSGCPHPHPPREPALLASASALHFPPFHLHTSCCFEPRGSLSVSPSAGFATSPLVNRPSTCTLESVQGLSTEGAPMWHAASLDKGPVPASRGPTHYV